MDINPKIGNFVVWIVTFDEIVYTNFIRTIKKRIKRTFKNFLSGQKPQGQVSLVS